MYRSLLMVATLALALVATLTLAPAPPAAAIPTAAYCLEPEEAAFLSLINQYRAQHGLAPLRTSQTVGAAAEHHSLDMATLDYFSHTLASGEKWSDVMRSHGYTYNTYRGENIAAGNASASATFLQWKNSPGHNANMLNPNYAVIGIGRAYSASSTYGYYWTTDFGGYIDAPAVSCGQSAPVAPTVAPTAPPQQPAPPSGGGRRSLRGGGGSGGGSVAPTPSAPQHPSTRPSVPGSRSIR